MRNQDAESLRRDAVPAMNQALMAATRALVPMDYTSGDRFDPDPALKQAAYPVLDPIRVLAVTACGSDEALFASVAARRALNRVAHALDAAQDALADFDQRGG